MENRRLSKELLIIMPAYNEEHNIVPVLKTLLSEKALMEHADILVMNDSSSDRTEQVARETGVNVVTHIYNLGYGSALQLGYKYAVKKGYKYVIQLDADGQHDPCNVEKIYEALKTADEDDNFPDIVLGSRFMEGSSTFTISIVKKIAIFMFSRWIYRLTKKKVLDPTSGLQGLSRRTFKYYSGYTNFDDRYPDANMILQMLLLGFRLKEIPATMHQRTVGVSMHSGLKPVFYMIRMFFSMMAVWMRVKLFKVNVVGTE